ncbi:mannitol dehydrogenase family protein [Roseitranquillus sediminis]|uniref:mannitol dehydrogenase family protein n=1 Tax=Roseitranquillus sediminis TaxID=2809051 RepID=UPI001D0C354B|nr:mannitol dehydrogenase family protein [Roseitranquillus sediminis]
MAERLNLSILDRLPASVERPRYRRDELSRGIVHIGIGNFHRAHMALYLHDLFQEGRDLDWAIVGAGVRQGDARMRDELAEQDWLTTLVELDPERDRPVVTGPMIDFVPIARDNAPLIKAMSDPAIRIVSLTVTEGGYYIDPASGAFDPDHPDMQADAATPDQPVSAFGAIIAALQARRAAGVAPFTVMSCDNLPENGHVTRDTVLGLARQIDGETADWIAAEVAFPNAMVDRITPATSDRERKMVRERWGIEDARPIACESFRQWVLEDKFTAGRPAFETVGVTMTDDVAPFETMKIRILNGGHATIAYPSALLGLHYVHEAIRHPLVRAFLDRVEREEIIPIVPPVPDTDLDDYYAQVVTRLENPGVGDTVPRLCLDGSNRQPKFILPSVRDRLAAGQEVESLSLVSALWARYLGGPVEDGTPIEVQDEAAERLVTYAQRAKKDPAAFLQLKEIFGSLADEPRFAAPFARHLSALWSDGTASVLARHTGL